MAIFNLSRSTRLSIIIAISLSFFLVEISGKSKPANQQDSTLVADAFHYLNDLIGFVVALIALKVSEKPGEPPSYLSFGWQRSSLLGAFFNGVFLMALGVSIILQSIERFVSLEKVENPELILIIGCVGLTLNIISVFFIHEHGHDHHGHGHGHSHSHATPEVDAEHDQNTVRIELENQEQEDAHENHRHATNSLPAKRSHDLGVMGVLLHVIGDAINNIGVIIAALVIWKATHEGRYYADPGVSLGIGILILVTAIPLVKNSGSILLDTVPLGVNLDDVQHDLETIPGVLSVHELHAWRLNQNKAIASAHVVTSDSSLAGFMARAQRIGECLHAYGIHSVTLQPELAHSGSSSVAGDVHVLSSEGDAGTGTGTGGLRLRREARSSTCKIVCRSGCEALTCCG
ncbi:hypothetical protein RJZ57_000307 [Blastomyces gilchristii]